MKKLLKKFGLFAVVAVAGANVYVMNSNEQEVANDLKLSALANSYFWQYFQSEPNQGFNLQYRKSASDPTIYCVNCDGSSNERCTYSETGGTYEGRGNKSCYTR